MKRPFSTGGSDSGATCPPHPLKVGQLLGSRLPRAPRPARRLGGPPNMPYDARTA